jgi:ABC-type nitrate/sulfonate/bicarbonate transport system substrate-binding protein
MSSQTALRVALEWTPSTNHTGIFLAISQGFYSDLGLDVQIVPLNGIASSKRLATGDVDLALCASESLFAFAETGKSQLQAIYAVFQGDIGAVASTTVQHMRDLSDKSYGSYDARYENAVIRAMVDKDGGDASKVQFVKQQGSASLFDAMKQGGVDATWVFVPWEGVEAEMEGAQVKLFDPADYDIPYGYSLVVARNASAKKLNDGVLRNFVKASRKGYELAKKDIDAAVQALEPHCSRPRRFLHGSQTRINALYGDGSQLGTMTESKWQGWITWLEQHGMMRTGSVEASGLFTNEFHPKDPD